MRKTKEQKGITLVALVITIILLLILAGISIQAITNTGIFEQAENAKKASEIASIKEKISLDIYEKQLEPPVGSITDEQLETILGKYGTVNKEDGKIVGITTAKGYEILLKDIYGGETVAESVPDGATVTPANDITTWLKTGEISNQYSYTTIEQVIADTTCTESLMNNENAMKYLARSTEFANAICESETAMTYLGQSAYLDDTVLNSDLWSESICNSTYFESVLCDKVPTMTSNTTPSGKASAYMTSISSQYYSAYNVFDGDNSTHIDPDNGNYGSVSSCYNAYMFTKPINIKKISLNEACSTPNIYKLYTFELQYSNDGNSWTSVGSFDATANSDSTTYMYNSENRVFAQYWRLKYITSNSSRKVLIREIQFYGRYHK